MKHCHVINQTTDRWIQKVIDRLINCTNNATQTDRQIEFVIVKGEFRIWDTCLQWGWRGEHCELEPGGRAVLERAAAAWSCQAAARLPELKLGWGRDARGVNLHTARGWRGRNGWFAYGYLHFPAVRAPGQRPVRELCPLEWSRGRHESFSCSVRPDSAHNANIYIEMRSRVMDTDQLSTRTGDNLWEC